MGTAVVLAVLAAIVFLALRSVIRSHRNGTHCADCAAAQGCPHCHPAPDAHAACPHCAGHPGA